jgi:hypothetical protein
MMLWAGGSVSCVKEGNDEARIGMGMVRQRSGDGETTRVGYNLEIGRQNWQGMAKGGAGNALAGLAQERAGKGTSTDIE